MRAIIHWLRHSPCIIATMLCVSAWVGIVHAEVTAPQRLIYNGHLLDSSGNPISQNHDIRFSFWESTDYLTGDVDASGSINTGATNFAGWSEVHTVTPASNGYFNAKLGSVTSLPSFASLDTDTLLNLHIQLEVKASTDPDSAYELMDINVSDDTTDRSSVASVPFALNADLLDQREIGTGSGDIALLGSGNVFDLSFIPGGTDSDVFVIDFDDTETGEISLQFGSALGRILSYNIPGGYFNFNDSVRIEGDLTVTGLINGIDITNITSSAASQLKASSGAGLNLNIAAGSYRIRGVVTNYPGASNVAVVDNDTNYVYFTSTGLTVNQTGFPADMSIIRIAEVDTSGGSISIIRDRRVFFSDDREVSVQSILRPEFEGVALQGDGSDNVGRMFVAHDAATQTNYYNWTSTKSAPQDYDLFLKHPIHQGFVRWEDGSIEVSYRTTSADINDNKIDVSIFDTNGTAVTLSGATTDLASTSWSTTRIEFTGNPTWEEGEEFLIRVRAFARNDQEAHIGSISIRQQVINN